MSKRQRRITRREFVGTTLAAAGVFAGAPALLRGPESQRQVEHRVHRLRRPRQRQPQRAHDHAGPCRAAAGCRPRRRHRIRTRTSSSSAT